MENKFDALLKLALPYYEKGRQGDVEHVKWLCDTVPKYISDSEISHDILMPVVILHDVGYSKISKDASPFDLNIRKAHSEFGAEIAQEILTKLNYPKKLIAEIKRLILKHDNWAFGDNYDNEPVLRAFNNFDAIWVASEKGFDIVRKFTGQSRKEFYKQIEAWFEEDAKKGRKFHSKKIENLYLKLMHDRKTELGM